MNFKVTLCLCAVFLSVVVIGFVLLYAPVSVLRHIPIYNGSFVYKYYLVDENGDIQDVLFRCVKLSQSDTEKLFGELSSQQWSTKISNDWNNHKIVITTVLGIKFTINIQSVNPDRVQINMSGAWLDSESELQIWSILDSYIVDAHIANGP